MNMVPDPLSPQQHLNLMTNVLTSAHSDLCTSVSILHFNHYNI